MYSSKVLARRALAWSGATLLTAFTAAVFVAAAALVWAWLLRKQVRAQSEIISRKLIEATLLEERYRNLFENAADIVYTHDPDGTLTSLNSAYERITGHSREMAVGRNIGDVLSSECLAMAQQMIDAGLTRGESNQEVRAQTADSRELVFEVSARVLRRNGKAVSVQGIARNVTDRKRADDSLRRSERHFRSLIENISDTVALVDRNGMTTYESPSVTSVLGYEPGELVGMSGFDLIHPEDVETARVRFSERRNAAASSSPMQMRYRHKDGSWRVLEVVANNLLHDPAVNGIVITSRDVTERKRAEEALRQAHQALRAVIEASPLAIAGMDMNGVVQSWNKTAEQLFGWTEAEVVGHPLPNVPAGQEEHCQLLFSKSRSGKRFSALEIPLKRKDGILVDLAVWTSPLRDANGAVNGVMAMAADVTDRKRLEEQLRQSKKMEAIGRLAGGIAHDFNNLLTVIVGHCELLMLRLDSSGEDLFADIEEIKKAGERAASLTGQLLAFSRQQMLQPKVLDLNSVIADLNRMLRRLIGEDVEVVTHLQPGLGRVKADPSQLEQVVVNLVVNARDAMPRGGRLSIRTANADSQGSPPKRTEVPEGSYVTLTISDSGVGMDENTKAHLFEPFFTTKEQGKGTGLGLSTVYGIIEQSGGYVTVDSQLGQGSTFTIWLPRIYEQQPEAPKARPDAPIETGKETILLVDDEGPVRRLMRITLESAGYKVIEAGAGPDALRLAKLHDNGVDLVITDVVMPKMNGRELADRLLEFRPNMPVLYISGYTGEKIFRQGVLEADAAFLPKPFTRDALISKVRSMLDAVTARGI